MLQLIAQKATAASQSGTGAGPLGLGIMFGEPTGINLKYWLNSTRALNFGLTYSFGNSLVLLGDYLWHFPSAFSFSKNQTVTSEFTPYIGVGGAVFFQSTYRNTGNLGLGVRIPLGIEFLPHRPPIGVFLELAPGVGIAPSVYGFLQGDLGIRFYF